MEEQKEINAKLILAIKQLTGLIEDQQKEIAALSNIVQSQQRDMSILGQHVKKLQGEINVLRTRFLTRIN